MTSSFSVQSSKAQIPTVQNSLKRRFTTIGGSRKKLAVGYPALSELCQNRHRCWRSKQRLGGLAMCTRHRTTILRPLCGRTRTSAHGQRSSGWNLGLFGDGRSIIDPLGQDFCVLQAPHLICLALASPFKTPLPTLGAIALSLMATTLTAATWKDSSATDEACNSVR